MEYAISDPFPCTPEAYWRTFFDDDFQDGLYDALEIEASVLEFAREGPILERTLHLVPRRQPSAVIQRVAGGPIAYSEYNRCDFDASQMQVVTTPTHLVNSLTSHGVYRVIPDGEGGCLRIWEGTCVCTVPLVGSVIASEIIREVQESYARATDFTLTWLAQFGPN